jgi:hypothetical protein
VDVIVEFGHTLVENGELVETSNTVLNWRNHPIVPEDWMSKAIRRQFNDMGAGWHFTWDVMDREGVAADNVLRTYHELLSDWQSSGLPIIMHNGVGTDRDFLQHNFKGFLNLDFDFKPNAIIDTGAIFKASKALSCGRDPSKDKWLLPQAGDTLGSYFYRVTKYPAKGLTWKMAECLQLLGLMESHQIDLSKSHRAGFDSWLCYIIMEAYRSKYSNDAPINDPAMSATTQQQPRQSNFQFVDEFSDLKSGGTPVAATAFRRQRRV